MADRLTLSNDTFTGYKNDDHTFYYTFIQAGSAHGNSGAGVAIAGPMPQNGRVVDFAIGVTSMGVSASGFVSGDVNATLRINSAAVCSTIPSFTGLAASATVANRRKSTNLSGGTSAVINIASAAFSTGDHITMDYDAQSGNSGTIAVAGTGLFAMVKVRYAAS